MVLDVGCRELDSTMNTDQTVSYITKVVNQHSKRYRSIGNLTKKRGIDIRRRMERARIGLWRDKQVKAVAKRVLAESTGQ